MKTYFENGTSADLEFIIVDTSDQFVVQEELLDDGQKVFFHTGDHISYDIDGELAMLFSNVCNLYFTSDEMKNFGLLPISLSSAGINDDCDWDKDTFVQFLIKAKLSAEINDDCNRDKDPFVQFLKKTKIIEDKSWLKLLYVSDIQMLVSSISNNIIAMESLLRSFFVLLSSIDYKLVNNKSSDVIHVSSEATIELAAMVESYFVKAYSILDFFTKLVYEIENPVKDFTNYSRLKSKTKLWGDSKHLKIPKDGLILEKCELTSIIGSIRNEVVHNGAFSFNSHVYVRVEDYVVKERYMTFPNIEDGHLATFNNRNHFYSQHLKCNNILPKIHSDFMNRIYRTATVLNNMSIPS